MARQIIRARGLSKRYTLSHQNASRRRDTLGETVMSTLRAAARRFRHPLSRSERTTREEFWALRDVSFDVERGSAVGIIGRNGAGKSTLLKILSRITEPTLGEVTLNGRVASLLEVGTGFHQELTGRENIFLNGAILGMSRVEVRSKFDEIVAFAEVENFLDTPVKRYSSGMYMRLAFAVAAHLEPEILVVDEVLAVGDAQFQKKCLGKMGEVAKGGRTVLFVSHNMSAVQQLCNRGVFLQNGKVIVSGDTDEVVRRYLGELGDNRSFTRSEQFGGAPTIVRGRLTQDERGDSLCIELAIASGQKRTAALDIRLTDIVGGAVGMGSLGAFCDAEMVALDTGETALTIEIDTSQLAVGSYRISFDLTEPNVAYFDRLSDCLGFELTRPPTPGEIRVFTQQWGHGSYRVPVRRAD